MLDAVGAKPQGDPCQRAGIFKTHQYHHHHDCHHLNRKMFFFSDEMFTKIDADNSGELDVQEFMKGCQEDQVKVDTLIAVVGRENAVSLKKVAYSILVATTSSSCLLIISSINFHLVTP